MTTENLDAVDAEPQIGADVAEWIRHSRKHEARAKAHLSDVERLTREVEFLRSSDAIAAEIRRADAAEHSALRYRLAHEFQIPVALITGDDEAEMRNRVEQVRAFAANR